jgi:cell division protein ZapA
MSVGSGDFAGLGQVTVTLNGRNYRLRCGDGEETRLFALADHLRSKIDSLVTQFGQAGDDRLLVMAALMIADELFEAKPDLAASGRQAGAPAETLRKARTSG